MRLINAVRELRVERGEDIRSIALHTAAERAAMCNRVRAWSASITLLMVACPRRAVA